MSEDSDGTTVDTMVKSFKKALDAQEHQQKTLRNRWREVLGLTLIILGAGLLLWQGYQFDRQLDRIEATCTSKK